MEKRVFLIVLDSFGIGAEPDAAAFGDEGTNTLGAIAGHPNFNCPNLKKLGLFNIDGVTAGEKTDAPAGAFARLQEQSMGKDTTIGHWEIAGVVSPNPLPTFPNGFPEELIQEFEAKDRPQSPLQSALFRHRGAEGLRRAGHEGKCSHRLHQRRQRVPGGRPRGAGARARALPLLRDRP